MTKPLRRILLLLLVAALAVPLVWYWSRPKPVPVLVQSVARGLVEATVANTRAGTIKACRRASLSPPSGGQIAKLPIHKGERVKAGQVLLELWNDDLTAQRRLAGDEAVAARAQADQACTVAQVAGRNAQRLIKLRRQQLASVDAVDKASGDATAQAAACAAARAQVKVAEARVDVAQAALDRTILTAPFDGTVAEINGELGEFVTPSPIGIPTPPAVDLMDLSCLYVSAPIDEVDAPAVQVGQEARISLDAFPGRSFPGRVRRIAPYVQDVEKQSRTVDIEVDFADPAAEPRLLPGYSADVEIVLATRKDTLRVPTEAVLQGHRVLVYDPADGRLHEQDFKPGLANWQYTEVLGGLSAGQLVVTSVDRTGVTDGAYARPEAGTAQEPR